MKTPTSVSVLTINEVTLMNLDPTVPAKYSPTHVGRKLHPPQDLDPTAVLEAFTRDELDDDRLISRLTLCCRNDANKVTEALLLLDQYHRRGLLETSVFLAAKTELNLVASISKPTCRADSADHPSTMTALDQFSSGVYEVVLR